MFAHGCGADFEDRADLGVCFSATSTAQQLNFS
jgi:hypothetical protein